LLFSTAAAAAAGWWWYDDVGYQRVAKKAAQVARYSHNFIYTVAYKMWQFMFHNSSVKNKLALIILTRTIVAQWHM